MKFLVATYGTEGDVRPLSALCRALTDAGHETLLMADRATLPVARQHGVPTAALSGDIKGEVDPSAAISKVVTQGNGLGMAGALAAIASANAPTWHREITEAGQDCDAILVSGLAAFVGSSAAEKLGIPAIGLGMIPISPTSQFATPFVPPSLVPAPLNRASHRFVNAALWRAFRKSTNVARAAAGMAPRRENWLSNPMLYGISPSLVTPPADWPANTRVCGQWLLPEQDWTPPQALLSFLEAGEAPVYVGFGSMVGFDQHKLLREVVAALDGRRALFYPGWSGREGLELPSNFFVLDDTPHSWLFPRVAAVMHHGGSGTTHSAARAGVPSVVVPFTGDQPFWAARLRQAGVAGPAINGHRPRASALASALDFAGQGAVVAKARELGARMRSEDGLRVAVRFLEELLHHRPVARAA